MSLLDLEWWAYLFIVISFFMACLGLNYVVKKMNEARIDERIIRMLHKASTTQSTQVNGPLIVMETNKLRQNISKTTQQSPTGISLVFNQEDNKRRKDLEDTFNIIKSSMDSRKFEALSLNTNKSLETIDVSPLNRSDHKVNDISIKIIESTRNDSKESSPHNVTEKVLVKKNEIIQDREPSLDDQSDCYVTELIPVKNIKDGHVATIRTASVVQSDSNIKKLTSVNESRRVIPRETAFLIQSDNNLNEDVTIKKSESTNKSGRIETEETSSNQRNDYEVAEHFPIKNNDSGPIVTESGFLEITQKDSNDTGAIKKSKKDIDAASFIKKTVDYVLSQIAIKLKTTAIDPQHEKKTTDRQTDVAKETSSSSGSSYGITVTELNFDGKCGYGSIAATDTSETGIDVNVAELSPITTSESGLIFVKETSSRTGSGRNTMELSLIKKEDLGGIAAKETSNIRNDVKVAELSLVKMRKSEEETLFPIISNRDVTEASLTKKISASGGIAVKETCVKETRSDDSVVGLSPINNRDSGRIVVDEISYHGRSDHTEIKLNPVKMSKSGRIVANETSSHARSYHNVTDFSPIKVNESVRNAAKATSSQSRSIKDIVSVKKCVSINEPRRIEAEETSSDEPSECNVTEYFQKESGRLVTKTSIVMISPKDSEGFDAHCKSNEDVESGNLLKKTIADTSKTKDDAPEKGKALADRIKALLTPPMLNEDVMILKPSSSRKKK